MKTTTIDNNHILYTSEVGYVLCARIHEVEHIQVGVLIEDDTALICSPPFLYFTITEPIDNYQIHNFVRYICENFEKRKMDELGFNAEIDSYDYIINVPHGYFGSMHKINNVYMFSLMCNRPIYDAIGIFIKVGGVHLFATHCSKELKLQKTDNGYSWKDSTPIINAQIPMAIHVKKEDDEDGKESK